MIAKDNPYQILIVDDDKGLSLLMQKKLERNDFKAFCVPSGAETISWINQNRVDLVLLDYKLPDMTGEEVIDTLQAKDKLPPFILITGQGDERIAVDMLKKGALDYLVKDRALLEFLPSVVTQAFKYLEQQKHLADIEESLRQSEAQYRDIFNSTTDAFFVTDFCGNIVTANPQATAIYGYSLQELTNMSMKKLIHTDYLHLLEQLKIDIQTQGIFHAESVDVKKDGTLFDVEIKGTVFDYRGKKHLLIIIRDISERKWVEEELKLTNQQLRLSEQGVRERESRLRAIFQGSAIGISLFDLGGRAIESNQAFQNMLGFSKEELREKIFTGYVHQEDRQGSQAIFKDLVKGKCERYQIEQRYIHRNGKIIWVRVTASLIRNDSGRADYIISIIEDIGERKQAEESLRQSEAKYRSLFKNMLNGFAYHQIIIDEKDKTVDYILLEANNAFTRMTRIDTAEIIGKKISKVPAATKKSYYELINNYGDLITSGGATRYEKHYEPDDSWFSVTAYSPEKGYFVTLIEDISDRRQIEEELRSFASELESSNRQLEHFAKTVATNLQDQLQEISENFEKLTQYCKKSLDTDSQKQICRISNQTQRMQMMLTDLLLYSKLVNRANPFAPVNLSELVPTVMDGFSSTFDNIGCAVNIGALPVIQGDEDQLSRVFERLIDNSIKFRSDKPLTIDINAELAGKFWDIKITDNGIGLEKAYHESVFDVFQIVHSRKSHQGTGVGLAVSKKIIERHGGKIWIESQPNEGCTIVLTIPKNGFNQSSDA